MDAIENRKPRRNIIARSQNTTSSAVNRNRRVGSGEGELAVVARERSHSSHVQRGKKKRSTSRRAGTAVHSTYNILL